jgi:hypothetical protein
MGLPRRVPGALVRLGILKKELLASPVQPGKTGVTIPDVWVARHLASVTSLIFFLPVSSSP